MPFRIIPDGGQADGAAIQVEVLGGRVGGEGFRPLSGEPLDAAHAVGKTLVFSGAFP